jgi:hypothetical protein
LQAEDLRTRNPVPSVDGSFSSRIFPFVLGVIAGATDVIVSGIASRALLALALGLATKLDGVKGPLSKSSSPL